MLNIFNVFVIVGVLFVYSRPSPSGTWSFIKYFTSTNTATFKNFGWSVAASASSNLLLIGAWGQYDNGYFHPGTVLVYSMTPTDRTSVTYQAIIQAPAPSNTDSFGMSIALGPDAVFIGGGGN